MGIIETLEESILRRRDECTSLASKSFHPSVRAVIAAQKGLNPQIIGSCILMEVDSRRYLVTAAHIIDEMPAYDLYVAGMVGSEPVPLNGLITTSVAPRGNRSFDKIDCAFWEIDSKAASSLGDVSFISTSRLSYNRIDIKNRLFLAMGYPVSKNKKNVDHSTRSIKTTLAKYTAEAIEGAKIASDIGVSGDKHIFLKLDKYAETADGKKVNSIEPVGMSGGPLIDLGNFSKPEKFDQSSSPTGYLAGMTIERNRKHKVIVAVRIEVIIGAISTGPSVPA